MEMICRFCQAFVNSLDVHEAWHAFYDLHAIWCAKAQTQQAQKGTGAYLFPQPCSCGLEEASEPVASS